MIVVSKQYSKELQEKINKACESDLGHTQKFCLA